MSDPERELLARCQAGDEAAWAELYRRYAPVVQRFLLRMMGFDPELDDLVQQVFVEVFRSMPRFRHEARFTTWLYRIASHVVGKRIRTESRRRRRREALALHHKLVGGGGADPSGAADAARRLEALGEVLETLSVDHRLVWTLREVEGLSTDEVAEALRVRPGTVRSRLFHARRKVLDRLAAAGQPAAVSEGATGASEA